MDYQKCYNWRTPGVPYAHDFPLNQSMFNSITWGMGMFFTIVTEQHTPFTKSEFKSLNRVRGQFH